MKDLVVLERASFMAREAYIWYEQQQENVGERFISEIEEAYNRLRSNPESYALITKNYRQLKLPGFPYVIVFEIDAEKVIVYAIFHTSRNPRKKIRP
ncbi:MAG: type II toxin-antitoxin system RelE/ParE family toxin [Mucilaginibacter polytrichastri]|nr:type II toxin-antitoxin system RelE/ParE family toxin [Mucilaginibacter polytrichastri]